jgi:hypothetical protein
MPRLLLFCFSGGARVWKRKFVVRLVPAHLASVPLCDFQFSVKDQEWSHKNIHSDIQRNIKPL